MDLLLIIAMTFIGCVAGLFVGAVIPQAPIAFLMLTSCFGGAVGLLNAYAILYLNKMCSGTSKRTPRKRKLRSDQADPPRQFSERLAQFAGQVDQTQRQPEEQPRSKMPFWTSVKEFVRSAPKSSSSIRKILWNIRRILRGGSD